MENQSKILSPEDIEVINAKFGIELLYNNATHYRAAQTIWNLWKASDNKTPDKETEE
ncbi:hypothetical protein [Cyclobacterium marinum]|uniref:Uncharacterized protein n=1 Tax=Cyclobacterium marinum (strain ATCC 25205 / DSM 745 / LMG 13164 / NCIMB 1802) TaxID=880070 RepID=G0J1Y2_CYCMS|nr:hypothetical protein [Cyclobacterium marinum]AEL23988.1 hypothetical protein Cycma_0205 [Cyclobacterium marinum DSM 745]